MHRTVLWKRFAGVMPEFFRFITDSLLNYDSVWVRVCDVNNGLKTHYNIYNKTSILRIIFTYLLRNKQSLHVCDLKSTCTFHNIKKE